MKSLFTSSLLAAALLAAGAAQAQGLGPQSDGPIDISADELEVQNKECVSTWRGRAEMLQGQARLRADVLKAFFQTKAGAQNATGSSACGDLIRIEAHGSVYYVTAKDERARGDDGTYDAQNETVTLTGDVVAVQGENVLRGNRMTFNTKTGEGRLIGDKARPRGVFYPAKKNESAAK